MEYSLTIGMLWNNEVTRLAGLSNAKGSAFSPEEMGQLSWSFGYQRALSRVFHDFFTSLPLCSG